MTIFAAINNAFVIDVNVNCIVEISLTNISILSILDLSANDNSDFIDLKAAENFIYALSFENDTTEAAITVLNVFDNQRKIIMMQHFRLETLDVRKNVQEMTVLI